MADTVLIDALGFLFCLILFSFISKRIKLPYVGLIIIPAAYASIRLQFYDYFLIDNEGGAIESIKKSINITKGYTGELFVLGAILSIIVLISLIPLMIGLFISIPLTIMVNTNVYLKLNRPN